MTNLFNKFSIILIKEISRDIYSYIRVFYIFLTIYIHNITSPSIFNILKLYQIFKKLQVSIISYF